MLSLHAAYALPHMMRRGLHKTEWHLSSRSMEFSIPEHAWEALRKARRLLLPGLVDNGRFKGKMDAWELDMRELHELRQVRLLAVSLHQ